MQSSIKRFFNGLTGYIQKDLLSSLSADTPSQPPAEVPVAMDLLLSHTQAIFPAYVPTQEEEQIIADYREIAEPTQLQSLICKVHDFGGDFQFADLACSLRRGNETARFITAAIATVEDDDLRRLLERNLCGDSNAELLERFPWLKTRGQSTPYTKLICAGEAPANATVWLGTINGLRSLMARVYMATNAVGEVMVWASDYERVKYYARFRKDPVFHGAALPKALYAEIDQLADVIDGRGLKRALTMTRSEYSIVRRELEEGDHVYTVFRHDTPMISFFFTGPRT